MQPFALSIRSKVNIQTTKFNVQNPNSPFFVKIIQMHETRRALIGFLLTPFWLAKDAL
jgi:hypothetical protein